MTGETCLDEPMSGSSLMAYGSQRSRGCGLSRLSGLESSENGYEAQVHESDWRRVAENLGLTIRK